MSWRVPRSVCSGAFSWGFCPSNCPFFPPPKSCPSSSSFQLCRSSVRFNFLLPFLMMYTFPIVVQILLSDSSMRALARDCFDRLGLVASFPWRGFLCMPEVTLDEGLSMCWIWRCSPGTHPRGCYSCPSSSVADNCSC